MTFFICGPIKTLASIFATDAIWVYIMENYYINVGRENDSRQSSLNKVFTQVYIGENDLFEVGRRSRITRRRKRTLKGTAD